MTDPRITKLADILTGYSVKIKKGSIIKINCGIEAKDLALEIYKRILKKGAYPRLNVDLPGSAYTYFKHASEEQLKNFPELAKIEAEKTDGVISIGTEYNTKELSNISPKKIAMRRKVTYPISKIILSKDNWVICQYPTNSLAQDAEMSLEEYEDFVFSATNVDWKREEQKQKKLKKVLDAGSKVRIVGKDTDISFSIKGRTALLCCGKRNMPDGEVFIAPVENTTEGYIRYTYPAIYGGKEVTDVRLEFKKGKVVSATAAKNQDLLRAMVNTDAGSKYLGEFGIGMSPGIKKFTKQILFDEKINGTIHLALGMAYKEGGGKNDSAVHWDMIKDLRQGGAIYVDGKCIQKDGKFLIRL